MMNSLVAVGALNEDLSKPDTIKQNVEQKEIQMKDPLPKSAMKNSKVLVFRFLEISLNTFETVTSYEYFKKKESFLTTPY